MLNDNDNEERNGINENTLISMHHRKRKSQILETIHGTKYTSIQNQSNILKSKTIMAAVDVGTTTTKNESKHHV